MKAGDKGDHHTFVRNAWKIKVKLENSKEGENFF